MPGTTPMPGTAPTVAGAPGAFPGGAPGQQGQVPPVGTPEHAAFQFVSAINKGDFDAVEPFVSAKALGQLKEIRAKTLTDSKKQELKDKFATPQMAAKPKGVSGGKQMTLRSGNTFITLTVKKEGDDYKVAEMILREVKR
jgi:predicted lipid-binding transport protein (Tim44 family)